MPTGNDSTVGTDPFTRFWTDMMAKAAAGGTASAGTSPEAAQQMRKVFFDALAEHADQFMRSEQFLAAMKQSMDNALAFRQQLNQFFTKGLQFAQMPTRSDADHVALLVRGMEDRVMDKLEELSSRIERMEQQQRSAQAPEQQQTRIAGAVPPAPGLTE